MSYDFLEDHHIVAAFYPVADAFDDSGTTLITDYVSLENYTVATLLVVTGAVEDAAVSNLVTIRASDDNAGNSTTAMAFRHRVVASSTTVDVWGALTAATSSGFNFSDPNSAANTMWYATVTAAEVISAQTDAKFIAATIAETVDKTITAGGIWILSKPRYPQALPLTAIA